MLKSSTTPAVDWNSAAAWGFCERCDALTHGVICKACRTAASVSTSPALDPLTQSDPSRQDNRNRSRRTIRTGSALGSPRDVVTSCASASGDQMTQLLDLYAAGELQPEPVRDLGQLPPGAPRSDHRMREEFALRFGLRLADGTDEPLMMSTSEVVAAGIVATPSGASKLLHRLEQAGVVWSPGEMPALGKPDGTRLFLPGPRPIGPEPEHGWRVQTDYDASDDAPGPALEPGPVAVEAEVAVARVAVEPAVELPDEPCVGDAVGRGAPDALDGVLAAPGDAVGAGRSVSVGHGAPAYAAGPMVSTPPPSVLLAWALSRATVGSRNDVGFHLAAHARDNGFSRLEAYELLRDFRRQIPAGDHPYTMSEVRRTLRSVYEHPAREPWAGVWPEEVAA